jgi:hypothetical protein
VLASRASFTEDDLVIVLREARRVAKQSFHLLEEAAVAEPFVRPSPLRRQQPSPFSKSNPARVRAAPRQGARWIFKEYVDASKTRCTYESVS